MLILHSPAHAAHAPAFEFFRGERVPCFETPARAAFVLQALQAGGHELQGPDTDSTRVLSQVHSARYLAFLETAWAQWLALDAAHAVRQPFPSVWPVRSLRSDLEPDNFIARLGLYSMDNGSPLSAGTWAAAKAGADLAVSAAGRLSRGAAAVFCLTRPPGHHAGADFMGGYCFINNAAVAAQWFRDQGAARVAILDVDYHHGNGTQDIFYDRSDVLTVSIHADPQVEYPYYSGYAEEMGEGAGTGFNLNLPLPWGTDYPAYAAALETALGRIADHGAEALVVSLGVDTFGGDPISRFKLISEDFTRIGRAIASLSLPTVFVMEGGYAVEEIGINAVNVLSEFERRA